MTFKILRSLAMLSLGIHMMSATAQDVDDEIAKNIDFYRKMDMIQSQEMIKLAHLPRPASSHRPTQIQKNDQTNSEALDPSKGDAS
jgi:hypothetical protein